VLIPAFALGRTQEILGMLALMTLAGRLRRQPIYIGGLGRVFTEIYDLEAHRAHRHHSALQLNETLNLVVLGRGQAEAMRLSPGRICVLTSGMMTEHGGARPGPAADGGRTPRHLLRRVRRPETPGGGSRHPAPRSLSCQRRSGRGYLVGARWASSI
jgi:hypothetical protein